MFKKFFPKSFLAFFLAFLFLFAGCGEIDYRDEYDVSQLFEEELIPMSTIRPSLAVYFIDIGQGDSVLVTSGDKTMLIDAGENKYVDKIINFIESKGISKIDYLVGTHPHADHIGGMAKVIETFAIGEIFMPNVPHDTKTYEDLLKTIVNKGLQAVSPVPGSVFDFGLSKITVLAPFKVNKKSINDNSIVVRVDYGEFGILFMGDAELPVENEIMDHKLNVDANVIKIGHHGSNSSSGEKFIQAVGADCAVLFAGAGNTYGHPTPGILQRLKNNGVNLFRTDLNGDITITVGSNKYTVTPGVGEPETFEYAPAASFLYIGNVNSKKYHTLTCKSLPEEKNRVYFYTRQEAVNNKYDPCGNCKP